MSDKQYTAEEVREVWMQCWSWCVHQIPGRVDLPYDVAMTEAFYRYPDKEDQGLHIDPADLGHPEPGKEDSHDRQAVHGG